MPKKKPTTKRKTAKEKREESKKKLLESIEGFSKRHSLNDLTNTAGFFAMAYIIKQGVFNPFKKIFSIGLVGLDGEGGGFNLGDLFIFTGPGIFLKTTETIIGVTDKISRLPQEMGKKLADEITRKLGIINASDKTDDEKDRAKEALLTWANARAEAEGWAFGIAGAWAIGKFLSETTITELAEALDTFVPFT